MFTGLIQAIGRVSEVEETDAGKKFSIHAMFSADLQVGESVAVNGVCLTVAEVEKGPEGAPNGAFRADVMSETLGCTTLDKIEIGAKVNLERALSVGDRLGGHFVQGHVDGVGTILSIMDDKSNWRVEIIPPLPLLKYIAHKGSIAIDGVSLTVSAVKNDAFEISLIPHTLENTIFSDYKEGDKVNLEVDLLARYLEKLQS